MSEPATEWPVAQPVEPLELRIRQLESSLAALRDTQAMEDRLVDRLAKQIQAAAKAEAERLAAQQKTVSAPVATPVGRSEPIESGITPNRRRSEAETGVSLPAPFRPRVKLASVVWLLIDILRELLAIVRMFFDFNYSVAWSTRVLTVVLLLAILTSSIWDPLARLPWVVGDVLDKLVILVLAFVMLKALSREARQYQESCDPSRER
jgi:hypothetical protein